MEGKNIGLGSEWYAKSLAEVERLNKLAKRENFIQFSRRVFPFRIDEIYIDPVTNEKIFVEHQADQPELPRIYLRDQSEKYFKLKLKDKYFSKPYNTLFDALQDARMLLEGLKGCELKIMKNGVLHGRIAVGASGKFIESIFEKSKASV
jgi:hypothetical protein